METQIDKLQRKNRKKKSAQQVSQEEVLVKRLDKHKWHLIQMRDLSKRIEKGRVDPNQLDVLKDDIIYYVEEAYPILFYSKNISCGKYFLHFGFSLLSPLERIQIVC